MQFPNYLIPALRLSKSIQTTEQGVIRNSEIELIHLNESEEIEIEKREMTRLPQRPSGYYSEETRFKAQAAVNYAVTAGRIPYIKTQSCALCTGTAGIYHHESYDPQHWLDVVPLCNSCHVALHAHGSPDVVAVQIERFTTEIRRKAKRLRWHGGDMQQFRREMFALEQRIDALKSLQAQVTS